MSKRNDIEREIVVTMALYYAAVAGFYETRVEESKPSITFMELHDLPDGTTHSFSILVDLTGYQVTRYPENWVIEVDDKTPQQRERVLREGALEKALWSFTGQGSDYNVGDGKEARDASIAQLPLKDNAGEPLSHWSKLGRHPIAKDALLACILVSGPLRLDRVAALWAWLTMKKNLNLLFFRNLGR